jgi:hypothetical protein
MFGHHKGGKWLGKDGAKCLRMVIYKNIQVLQSLPFVDLLAVVGEGGSVMTLMATFVI